MSQLQIELRDLRLVQAIFLRGTTVAAAKALGLTQSGVSHQLRNLEERLQLEVFHRRGRTLQLTDAGAKLIEEGKEILQAVAALESDLRRGVTAPPRLRVATQCYTAYGWLPQATIQLRASGTALSIQPVLPRAPHLAQALLDDEIDLALCIDPSKEPRFCQRRLFDDELMLVTATAHALAGRPYVRGQDLADEDLLLVDSAKANQRAVGRVLFPEGGSFRSINYLPLTEAILEMVHAELGVTILPGWSVQHRVQWGQLARVRLGRGGLRRRWVGAYRRDSALASSSRALLALLKELGPPTVTSTPSP